ncbi:MAG: hypothetical protein ACRCRP_00475 [Metamycoplasmataceae bacterium]
MNKKVLFSLGFFSIAAVISPILITVSCSNEASVVNLNIIAKKSPKIIETDLIALEGKDFSTQLPVLQKLFEGPGLISENENKFTISVNKNNKVVFLIAKPGYTIDNKNTLKSDVYTLEQIIPANNLNITALSTQATLKISEVAELEGNDFTKQLPILKKMFTGQDLIETNKDKFSISINTTTKIVTLNAKSGYAISGKTSLSALAYKLEQITPANNLNITVIDKPVPISQKEINDLQGSNAPAQLIVLKKLFTGPDLNANNQSKFTILVNTTTKIVTLKANDGIAFNDKPTLNSNQYTISSSINLSITAIAQPANLSGTEIKDLQGTENTKKFEVLKKLFTGADLSLTNQNNFLVSVNTTNKIVTLEAKEGYLINNQKTLNSTPYILSNINLNITAIAQPANLSTAEIKDLQGTENTKKLAVLKKLFTGTDLNANNQNNFSILVDEKTNVVTLKSNTGYLINNQETLNSSSFNINLNITTQAAASLNINEINDLTKANTAEQLLSLQKVFTGPDLIAEYQNNFDVTVDKGTSIVTLTLKNKYTINGNNTLKSVAYKMVLIKTGIIERDFESYIDAKWTDSLRGHTTVTNPDQRLALQYAFGGVDRTNVKFLTYEIVGNTITLKANEGYSFTSKTGAEATTIIARFRNSN